ncbi:uncharacterized protein LOC106993670 [Macaca mulatta]
MQRWKPVVGSPPILGDRFCLESWSKKKQRPVGSHNSFNGVRARSGIAITLPNNKGGVEGRLTSQVSSQAGVIRIYQWILKILTRCQHLDLGFPSLQNGHSPQFGRKN